MIMFPQEALMMKKHTIFILACLVAALFVTGCSLNLSASESPAEVEPEAISEELQPSPDLSPEEVVKIQVEALQHNDDDDTGIEVTFRFASPANKQVTGPLMRFIHMVKNPAYRPMLNHKLAEYGSMEIDGDTASQRVTIIEPNGDATVYLFILSRQSEPPCQGCWMTDSVTVVPVKQQNLQGA